ncbi:hypothetical protein AJ79_01826 [Helicocarpus griseus UAMH5409]|uniref:Nitrogen regulatory protein areA GATA-like domain-containing protein n=1 Tax=Helicocarpus griseus UAMH5409 TaxID=1447875 RepID=A0A2B7Y6N5_9EURO|nr:hypothetical protein AJ79_01826 [Helicocarpus griseus UAMH5409]
MTEALPQGIVLHTERVSSEIESFGGVDDEDLAKLWRVYTTNRSTMREDEGRRLENLVWRIWSNKPILRTIQGTTLAGLFLHISEGESITRMGPERLREIAQSIPRIPPIRRHADAPSPRRTQPQNTSPKDGPNAPRKTSGNTTRTSLPPPILKKPRQTSGDSQKISKPPGGGALEDNTAGNLSLSPSPVAGHETPTDESVAGRPRKKKTTFAESVTSIQAEPVQMRKRTSQPSSAVSPARQSPSAAFMNTVRTSPRASTKGQGYPIPDESAISLSPIPTYTNPSPWPGSIVHRPAPTSNPTSHGASKGTCISSHEQRKQQQKRSNSSPTSQKKQPSEVSLVEKDFRARFVEKQLQESRNSSAINLGSSLAPAPAEVTEMVRTGDQLPLGGTEAVMGSDALAVGTSEKLKKGELSLSLQRQFIRKSTESDNPTDGISPSPSSAHMQPLSPQATPPAARPSLVRQHSQLSEMIERERRMSKRG